MKIDFYYAIGSRYSYLASTQMSALRRDTGCEIEWHPLGTARLMAARGANPFMGSPISGQYEWPYRELDAMRWAAMYGVPFREPRGRVEFDQDTVALAATAGVKLGIGEVLSRELFAGMFVDDVRELDVDECARRAGRCGIARETFLATFEDPGTLRALDATTRQAVAAGVIGVPSFVANGAVFWGNDRLVLLRYHLEKGV